MFKVPKGAPWRQCTPLPLRLVIGYGFVAHGWAKLSRGPGGFAKLLEQIGAPLPEATAWVFTFIEDLGGLAIVAGAFVAAVSVPLIVMMLGPLPSFLVEPLQHFANFTRTAYDPARAS